MKIVGLCANIQESQHFNERWDEHIGLYGFWASCLDEAYGLNPKFDYTLDFDGNHDLESEVHISKLLSEVKRCDVDGQIIDDHADFQKYESVVAVFDTGLELTYDPKSGFQISKIKLDYNDQDAKKAKNALKEQVKAAFIRVQATNAAQLEEINLDVISDPVQKYAVQQVCNLLDFKFSGTPIEETALPVNKALSEQYKDNDPKDVMHQEINGAVLAMASDIYMGVVREVANLPDVKKFSRDALIKASAPTPGTP